MANEQLLTVVQIETAGTLSQLDEIAAVEGVDVLFVGPMDLSFSLGLPRQSTTPYFARRLPASPKLRGGPARRRGFCCCGEQFEQALADGYTFIGLGLDMGVMAEGMRNKRGGDAAGDCLCREPDIPVATVVR